MHRIPWAVVWSEDPAKQDPADGFVFRGAFSLPQSFALGTFVARSTSLNQAVSIVLHFGFSLADVQEPTGGGQLAFADVNIFNPVCIATMTCDPSTPLACLGMFPVLLPPLVGVFIRTRTDNRFFYSVSASGWGF